MTATVRGTAESAAVCVAGTRHVRSHLTVEHVVRLLNVVHCGNRTFDWRV
jgi:hypothetical protein